MKKPSDRSGLQLNLPLPSDPATAIPADKQKELAMALIELLISELQGQAQQPEAAMNPKLTADHLRRRAVIYVRQSSMGQVLHNHESQLRQYGLADRARSLGFGDVMLSMMTSGVPGPRRWRSGGKRDVGPSVSIGSGSS